MIEACDIIRQWCFENGYPAPMPPEGVMLPKYVVIGFKHSQNVTFRIGDLWGGENNSIVTYIKNATGAAGLPIRASLGCVSDPEFFSKLRAALVEEKVLPL